MYNNFIPLWNVYDNMILQTVKIILSNRTYAFLPRLNIWMVKFLKEV